LRAAENPVPNTTLYRIVAGALPAAVQYSFFLLIAAAVTMRSIETPTLTLVYKTAAWFTLGAHSIAFTITVEQGQFAFPMRSIPGWNHGVRLLPPIALAAAGFWTARRTHLPSELRGAMEGIKLTPYYLPYPFGLALVARRFETPPAAMLPEPVRQLPTRALDPFYLGTDQFGVVAIAGVLYPVIFAGLGGGAAYKIDRHLDRTDDGLLLSLDEWIASVTVRWVRAFGGRSGSEGARSAVLAGAWLTATQLPGFALTMAVFGVSVGTRDSPVAGIGLGGPLGLFLVTSLTIGGLLWWSQTRGNGVRSSQGALQIGWLTGTIVHVIVWGTAALTASGAPGGLDFIVGPATIVVMTYAVGWTACLGAAAGAVLLMRHRYQVQLEARTGARGRPPGDD